ncbi:hypothetical protein BJ742DRAFT_108694 [Cladochytrium replicatum]|nr:hypothetical protein BJ742DRAFT_108694 [Cladochytrium replicatum]
MSRNPFFCFSLRPNLYERKNHQHGHTLNSHTGTQTKKSQNTTKSFLPETNCSPALRHAAKEVLFLLRSVFGFGLICLGPVIDTSSIVSSCDELRDPDERIPFKSFFYSLFLTLLCFFYTLSAANSCIFISFHPLLGDLNHKICCFFTYAFTALLLRSVIFWLVLSLFLDFYILV